MKSKREKFRLEMYGRPKTVFDPSNKKHRQYYMEFLETGSWRLSPVMFIIDDESSSVPDCIQKKIQDYYFKKEFGPKRRFRMLESAVDL